LLWFVNRSNEKIILKYKNMITKEKFLSYEAVREDGMTNMFDIKKVIELSEIYYGIELTREDITEIMKNYKKFKEQYL